MKHLIALIGSSNLMSNLAKELRVMGQPAFCIPLDKAFAALPKVGKIAGVAFESNYAHGKILNAQETRNGELAGVVILRKLHDLLPRAHFFFFGGEIYLNHFSDLYFCDPRRIRCLPILRDVMPHHFVEAVDGVFTSVS